MNPDLENLSLLRPIKAPNGKIYFVVKEKQSNKDQVIELEVKYDRVYQRWSFTKRVVYSSVSPVKILQLVKAEESDFHEDESHSPQLCFINQD